MSTTPRRLVDGTDDPRQQQLAERLRQLSTPAPPSLSRAAVERIEERLMARELRVPRPWLVPALAAVVVGCALFLGLHWRRPLPPAGPLLHEVTAAAGERRT